MSNTIAANTNRLLRQLMEKEGLTLSQACESLELDIEAGNLAMMTGQKVDITQIIEGFRPEGAEILIDIARNGTRDADRVKACQILLEGRGIMPEVNAAAATALLSKFEQMKKAVGIIDIGGPQPVTHRTDRELVAA